MQIEEDTGVEFAKYNNKLTEEEQAEEVMKGRT
jgi:hypothetical protein